VMTPSQPAVFLLFGTAGSTRRIIACGSDFRLPVCIPFILRRSISIPHHLSPVPHFLSLPLLSLLDPEQRPMEDLVPDSRPASGSAALPVVASAVEPRAAADADEGLGSAGSRRPSAGEAQTKA
jgi:hypothetical protein